MRDTTAITVENLTVHRGPIVAIEGLNLDIEGGRITAIVGPSGCGKTTLLRTLAGFERPVTGSVRLGGRLVASSTKWVAPERRRVGMVFQEGALFPHLTVAGNVRYGIRDRSDGPERVDAALERVGMLELGDRMPHQLSGGQQQRVALARALAPEPQVILLDEPFVNLDAMLRERVRQEVRRILEDAGITTVLVTHDQEEALSVAERVAVMDKGTILQCGSAREVYLQPASPRVAEFIGDGRLVPCRVRDSRFESTFGSGDCQAPDGPGRLLVRPEDLEFLPEEANQGATAIVVSTRFFGHDALSRVELRSGEVLELRSLASDLPEVGDRVQIGLRPRIFRVFRNTAVTL